MRIFLFCTVFIGFRDFGSVGRPQETRPGCRYEGKRYEELSFVNTSEPCLNCQCYDGSLRCRLRVCPRIPNPLPSGCKTRIPHENECCAELICDDYHKKEISRMRSSDSNGGDRHDDGCIWDGVHYAPGSAMMGSRRCEYCYCISGERRCVRPKCLLPLPGCIPLYAPYSCCPVAYNCTHSSKHSISLSLATSNGCKIAERFYEEGEMVRDIEWKTMCDNCFCAMGGIRCVPLACAPPLQGCTPIVREGQCCPSTYNCSGSIAVKSTQNFASYAFISKDYAKFRKETNFLIPNESRIEGRSQRDDNYESSTKIPESLEDSTLSILDVTSSTVTYETETMDNEIPTESMDYPKSTVSATAVVPESITQSWTSRDEVIVEGSSSVESTTGDIDYRLSTVIGMSTGFDYTVISDVVTTLRPEIFTIGNEVGSVQLKTKYGIANFNENPTKIGNFSQITNSKPVDNSEKVGSFDRTTLKDFNRIENLPRPENVKLENSEKIKEPMRIFQKIPGPLKTIDQIESQMSESPSVIFETTSPKMIKQSPVMEVKGAVVMPGDILVMNVTLKTNVSVGLAHNMKEQVSANVRPDIDRIVNMTDSEKKEGDDYAEYDYSEPTLPPSLPNVRIIPFVAADALVKDKESTSPVTAYPLGSVGVPPELRPTDVSSASAVAPGGLTTGNFYDIVTQENRFSPPVETQGGFVPREPSYFESQYHSTDLNLEIGTGVTVTADGPSDIANSHRNGDKLTSECMFEGRPYLHGELLPSNGRCIICICYYGDVTCSDEKCPPVKFGCQRLTDDITCCGKIVCKDPEESPTVVLDRVDDPDSSLKLQPPSPDPFRDVIRTEPAPDLPSLIEDMLPYLEHRITTTPLSFDLNFNQKMPLQVSPDEEKLINRYEDIVITTEKPTNSSDLLFRNSEISLTYPDSQGIEENHKKHNQNIEITTSKAEKSKPIHENGDVDSIFSFDSVFDLLFPVTAGLPEITSSKPQNFSFENSSSKENHTLVTEISSADGNWSEKADNKRISTEGFSVENIANKRISPEKSDNKRVSAEIKTFPGEEKVFLDEEKLVLSTKNSSTYPIMLSESVKNEKTSSVALAMNSSDTDKTAENKEIAQIGGLLKLAGCNIYGRMYRVGRIIVELSTTCLECRCTDLGVQCKQLEC